MSPFLSTKKLPLSLLTCCCVWLSARAEEESKLGTPTSPACMECDQRMTDLAQLAAQTQNVTLREVSILKKERIVSFFALGYHDTFQVSVYRPTLLPSFIHICETWCRGYFFKACRERYKHDKHDFWRVSFRHQSICVL